MTKESSDALSFILLSLGGYYRDGPESCFLGQFIILSELLLRIKDSPREPLRRRPPITPRSVADVDFKIEWPQCNAYLSDCEGEGSRVTSWMRRRRKR